MNPNQQSDRLDSLLHKIVDGQLADSDAVELNELIGDSIENQKRYLDYLDLHSMITELGGVPSESKLHENEQPVLESVYNALQLQPNRNRWITSVSTSQVLTALVAILLFANLLSIARTPRLEEPAGYGYPSRNEIAGRAPQLVGVTACVWNERRSPAVGSLFGFGEVVELIEGIAEFEIRNDHGESARVFAEGPATLFVRSDGQLALQNGLLIARAPHDGKEFRLFLPNGEVRFAGGTEVGIEASLAESRVHAFGGLATLNRGFGFGKEETTLEIPAGKSINFAIIDGRPILSESSASTESFGFMQSMSSDRLTLDNEYREAVIASKPAIYWRFSGQKSIRNEISERWTGLIEGGIRWKQFGNNTSAEFGSLPECSLVSTDDLWPDRPLEEYTVELWVKPSHYHNGAILALCEPGTDNHGLLLEIGAPYHEYDYHTRPNRFRFLHRSPPTNRAGESCYDSDLYEVRQWQYIVARKNGSQLELFIDGKLVGTEIETSALPENLQVVIGQLDQNRMGRSFVGQIDEIALYERALTDVEIQAHFHAGGSRKIAHPEK